jgi:hypothetical protein
VWVGGWVGELWEVVFFNVCSCVAWSVDGVRGAGIHARLHQSNTPSQAPPPKPHTEPHTRLPPTKNTNINTNTTHPQQPTKTKHKRTKQVGTAYAKERAALFAKKTLESLCSNRHIVVLGDFQTPRLPIFSFLVRARCPLMIVDRCVGLDGKTRTPSSPLFTQSHTQAPFLSLSLSHTHTINTHKSGAARSLLPALQLRLRPPQRPLRHPDTRGLPVRGALWLGE